MTGNKMLAEKVFIRFFVKGRKSKTNPIVMPESN